MEHHKADVWQAAGRGTAGDDTTRFLHELRQLRDGAGLGHAELAARAHYPYDTIKAAEVGPTLPDLPVLSAYVRGCGGTAEEWEERWRRLTRTPSLPVSASRHAGNSAAATAGARIGAATQVVDSPDPSVIRAALNRVAEGMAGGPDMDGAPLTVPPRPAYPADDAPAVSSSSDVAPADISMANGWFGDTSLSDTSLSDTSLSDTSLSDTSLSDVSMADVSLDDISLSEVSLPDVSLPEVSLADVPLGDVPLTDSQLAGAPLPGAPFADAFASGPADEPSAGSGDFSPFAPVTSVAPTDESLIIPADDPPVTPPVTPADALTAEPIAGHAEPAAHDKPKGWDPIRISTAWPSIGNDDPRVKRAADDAAAADAKARRRKSAPAESGTQPVVRQSAWARGVDAFGEPTSVARPGSRARTLMLVAVLICVLAVVLAIFA